MRPPTFTGEVIAYTTEKTRTLKKMVRPCRSGKVQELQA